jgi:hypothetical protein
MKKTIYQLLTAVFVAVLFLPLVSCTEEPVQQMYYEIKIFNVTQPGQAERVDNYLGAHACNAGAGVLKSGCSNLSDRCVYPASVIVHPYRPLIIISVCQVPEQVGFLQTGRIY